MNPGYKSYVFLTLNHPCVDKFKREYVLSLCVGSRHNTFAGSAYTWVNTAFSALKICFQIMSFI